MLWLLVNVLRQSLQCCILTILRQRDGNYDSSNSTSFVRRHFKISLGVLKVCIVEFGGDYVQVSVESRPHTRVQIHPYHARESTNPHAQSYIDTYIHTHTHACTHTHTRTYVRTYTHTPQTNNTLKCIINMWTNSSTCTWWWTRARASGDIRRASLSQRWRSWTSSTHTRAVAAVPNQGKK